MSAKKRLGSDPFSSKEVNSTETQKAQSIQSKIQEAESAESEEAEQETEEDLAWLNSAPKPADPPEPCESPESATKDAGTLPAQQVLEGLSTGACLIASDRKMLYVNQAMSELLGCDPDKLLGLDWEREVLRPTKGLEAPSWKTVMDARQAMFFKTRVGVCQKQPMEVEVRCWLLSGGGSDETCICALLSKPYKHEAIPCPAKAGVSEQLEAKLPEAYKTLMASPLPEPEIVALISWLFEQSPQLHNGEDLDTSAVTQVLQNCSGVLRRGENDVEANLRAKVEVESLSRQDMLLMSAGLLGLLKTGRSDEGKGGAQVDALVDRDHRGRPRLRVIDHGGALQAKLKLRAGKKSPLSWLANAVTNQGGSLLKVRSGRTEYRLTLAA